VSRLLYRIGRFSAEHKWRMVLVWFVAVVAISVAGQVWGGTPAESFEIPGTESQRAFDLLDARFPAQSGSTARIVFHATDGRVTDPAHAAGIAQTLDEISHADHVIAVTDPLGADGADLVSADGTIAYAEVRYDVKAQDAGPEAITALEQAARHAEDAGLQVELGGDVVESNQESTAPSSELVGLAVATGAPPRGTAWETGDP